MHHADDLAGDTLRVGRTFTSRHELTDAFDKAVMQKQDGPRLEEKLEAFAEGLEQVTAAIEEEAAPVKQAAAKMPPRQAEQMLFGMELHHARRKALRYLAHPQPVGVPSTGLRTARPRGAGRPRASASRSSARSGDSGDSDGGSSSGDSDSAEPASRGPAPSPCFSRPWRAADHALAERFAAIAEAR